MSDKPESEDEFELWVDTARLLPPPHTHVQISYNVPPKSGRHTQCNDKEWQLVNLVRQGDVAKTAEFLRQNTDVDINKSITLSSGRSESALSAAVNRGDEAMVRFLTSVSGLRVSDCVLLAAQKGHVSIVRVLLDFVLRNEGFEAKDPINQKSERFPAHATPLLLAARHGHFALVQLLVERGHHVPLPHVLSCSCFFCSLCLDAEKGLENSLRREETYEALSSTAVIFATAHDPFLRAFLLHQELVKCKESDLTFSAAYAQMAKNLTNLSRDLIACCRTNAEVELVLERKFKEKKVILPRLQLAMESGHKEFVAHPVVQHVLLTKWLGASPGWSRTSALSAVLHLLARMVALPFLAVLLVVAPFSGLAEKVSAPVNRLVSHLASYLIFLVLITIQGHVPKNNTGRTTTGLERVIFVFLLGHEVNLARMLLQKGFKRFFSQMWNIYDLVMLQVLWLWLWFWFLASDLVYTERKFWFSLHPVLVSEGFLAVGTIIAYGRILFLCQLSRKLGPMQVSLSKMFRDVAQCSLIFFLVILSFSAGVGGLYQYYGGSAEDSLMQPASFTNLLDSVRFLFWGVFGLSPAEYTSVVLSADSPNHHHFTQAVGTVCFAIYMLLVNVMLLNVLVAKMTNTFKQVNDNVQLEWTFGKTEVILDYMYQSVLPPPLNLIPTTRSVSSFVKSLCPGTQTQNQFKVQEAEDEGEEEEEYERLMSTLKKRYLSRQEFQEEAPTAPTPPSVTPDPGLKINPDVVAQSVRASLADYFENDIMAKIRTELQEIKAEALEIKVGKK